MKKDRMTDNDKLKIRKKFEVAHIDDLLWIWDAISHELDMRKEKDQSNEQDN